MGLVAMGLFGCGARSVHDGELETDAGRRDAGDLEDAGSPLCAQHPNAVGCPCGAIETDICYAGPESTSGVGVCRSGLHVCTDGVWGPCNGQVLPRVEVCNFEDDDCDGNVDEDVAPECGTCDQPLDCDCLGEGCDGWLDPEEGENVEHEVGKDWMDPCLSIDVGDAGSFTHAFDLTPSIAACGQIEFEGVTTAGALELEVRLAHTQEELASAEWIPVGTSPPDESPLEMPSEAGTHDWVEVRVRLLGEGTKLCRLAAPAFCGE